MAFADLDSPSFYVVLFYISRQYFISRMLLSLDTHALSDIGFLGMDCLVLLELYFVLKGFI